MKKPLLFIVITSCLLSIQTTYAQIFDGTARLESVEAFDLSDSPSIVDHLAFTNIGPTIFSGRVVDIAVDPDDPTHFYVAYASGGLWETSNNGTSFHPIFDDEMVMTIGAIAVDWDNDILWVGTGEVNSSRSSYAGTGIFKSSDNGKTWHYQGLPESHHIGRVVIHPENPSTLWVAALGHLYTKNDERGVYMTTDGGATWEKTLFINDDTGVVDLLLDTSDPDVLYAAAWQRSRKAWDFTEAGPGSGIYKSTDGGRQWQLMTTPSSGFPTGMGTGRIGLSLYSSGGNNRLYALLDNYNRRPPEDDASVVLQKENFKGMTRSAFLDIPDNELETYLRENRFPRKYTAKSVRAMIEKEEISPDDLALFLEDANSLLFDTPVIGAELYRSDDGGQSWTRTHDEHLDGLYNSYGYYFGVVSVDPSDADKVYIAGVPILRSSDGGKSFKNINGDNVHVDHHKIWVNPQRAGHLVIGNDGGVNISYDDGDTWIKCNTPAVGQFYYINVDNADPYNVYGGTQDNGVWKGSHQYREGTRWHSTGRYPYEGLIGGDGMQVQIDLRDNATIYTGFQFGNYFRINTSSGERSRITPIHELGQRPYRWNWQSPIHVSLHNQDIVYFGANVLFRSMDKGENFKAISGDLTRGGKSGDVPFGTLTTIHESPLVFGLIYTGSDDGAVYVTRDGGVSWVDISSQLPTGLWVSRIQASAHKEGRVFVALNGYRNDDFSAYLFMSEDYGQNWKNISHGLPAEPVNVVKEDPKSEVMLFVGTDRGTYVSLDQGNRFMRLKKGLTSAPVHDVVIHQDQDHLLIGTHGRSIFLGSIHALRQVAEMDDPVLTLFNPDKVRYRSNTGNRRAFYLDFSTNEVSIEIFAPAASKGVLSVTSEKATKLYTGDVDLPLGLSTLEYDLSIDKSEIEKYKGELDEDSKLEEADDGNYYLLPGKYTIQLEAGGQTATTELEITER